MKNPLRNKNGDWSLYRIIPIIIFLVLLGGTLLLGIRTVPSGYKGVKTQFGQIIGTADEGINWVNIWFGQDIVCMDLQIHKVTLGNLSCGTNDMQEVLTTISINYYIDSGYVEEIYRTLRTDWESRVIINNMQQSLKGATSSFKAEELLQRREAVKVMFLETLREKLTPYHITVLDVQLENFEFSDAFNQAIENKVTNEQNALAEKNKLEVIRYQQEQQIIIQEAEATMLKIQAEAYANSTLTRALADSEAIRMVSEQLKVSPEYLYYLFLMQWDGKLPIYWASDGSPIPFIDITTTP
jgi:regulator of protease activity HflC (stomatin/prohibitin superfamily)